MTDNKPEIHPQIDIKNHSTLQIPKKMGVPSSFTQEIADMICSRLMEGESLNSICKDEGFPAKGTVCRWLATNESFQDQYARAREFQADALADEIIDIADDSSNDWMERNDPDNPGWQLNGDHVQRSKLRMEARKWVAAKLKPKKYGDSTTIKGDKDNPIELNLANRLEKALVMVGETSKIIEDNNYKLIEVSENTESISKECDIQEKGDN